MRLDEVVFRALEKEPERRYQHASEVKSDVERITRPPASSPGSPARAAAAAAGDTSVVFNPSLPKIARWICGYALVVSPVLFALSLAGFVAFTLDESDQVIATEAFGLPLHLLTVVLLFVGGLKLRSLQRSGVAWVKAGLVLDLVWTPLYFVLWAAWTAADPQVLAPGNGRDFISISFVVLCYGFDILSLVWLTRCSRALPLA
ncbi:MAG TPA: hypothetical protein VG125_22100 [Pirellulales bacterium]|nr:hypothetical protein [Pirellulales bacterium]